MTHPDRAALLDLLAGRIEALQPGHPVRVAIDGPDAAGKTTLADELARRLAARGRPVIRVSADAFTRPRAERYRRGRDSAEGYYADGFDHEAMVRRLLAPLGPGGDRRYLAGIIDVASDAPLEEHARTAPVDAVLVVDGVFLGRAELAGAWDLRAFVSVTPGESLHRALTRDVPGLGSAAEVEARYRARYLPAQAAYLAADRPDETADVVVDNEDPAHPVLRARTGDPRSAAWAPADPPFAVPGYRREALPDPEAAGEDADLVEAIRHEIARDGPITFARFMERALYEPGHGYYRRPEPGPGTAAGDFLTAPETHPIFGAAIGRLLEQAWDTMGRPAPFIVTEPGAGTGALAAGLLGGLRDLGSPLLDAVRYRPAEVEPERLEALRARLAEDGLASFLTAGAPEPGETGAVVANEVMDALPVHRVVGRSAGLRELLVTTDTAGEFAWHEAEPTTPALGERLAAEGVTLANGQVTEVCLGLDEWLAGATAHLAHGLVVLVDYAAEPADLHGPGRPNGSLRSFVRHAVGADPFRHVGRADLTATVDLAAVRAAAARAGLTPVGETTQAELLARVGTPGLTDAWLRRPGATLQDALHLRSALARLLDPRGMGGFGMLVFGRGLSDGLTLPALERVRRLGG